MARVVLTIEAEERDAVEAVNELQRRFRGLGDTSEATGRKQRNAARSAREEYRRMDDTIRRVGRTLAGLVGIASVSVLARQVVQASDNWRNYRAQLQIVTESQRELNTAQRETFKIAQDVGVGLEATVNLYARIARTTDISQERVAALTETIQQSFVVSGASAQEMNAAVIQLAQGLAAGALRGDEFRSVMEQAPRLAIALAESLDVSIGGLRELAFAGELTSERLVSALEGQADAIAREFENIPQTVERATTRLSNAFTKYIGESEAVQEATDVLIAALIGLAENLDLVAVSVGRVLQAGALILVMRRLGPAILGAATATRTLGAATAALNARLTATAALAAAGGRAMAFLGGPVGVAALAAWGAWEAYQSLGNQLEAVGEISSDTSAAVEEAAFSMDVAVADMVDNSKAALGELRAELAATQAQLDQQQQRRASTPFGGFDPYGLFEALDAELIDKADELNEKIAEQESLLKRLQGPLGQMLGLWQTIQTEWEAAGDVVKENSDTLQAWADETENAAAKLAEKNAVTELGREAAIRLQAAELLAMNTTEEAAEAVINARDALIQEVRASERLEDQKQREQEARKRATEVAQIEAELITDIAEATADLVEASNEREAVVLRYAQEEAKLLELLDEEGVSTALVTERIRLLREEREAELDALDARLSSGEQIIADLQREITLSRLAGTEREFAAATWDLEREEVEKYGAEIRGLIEARDIERAAREQAEEFQSQWNNALDSVSRAFGDWVTGGLKSFSDFGDALKNIARRFLSDLIATFARNRIVIPIGMSLMGGVGGALAGVTGGGGGMGGLGGLGQLATLAGGGGGLFGTASIAGASGLSGMLGGGLLNAGLGIGGAFGSGLASTGIGIGSSGLLSGAFGGLGTGLGSMFGGGSLGFMGGLGAALPGIGLIAGAAALVDSLSGGGLFGTDFETTGRSRSFDFGPGGASGQLEIEQEKERSLFRGTERRTLLEDLDQQTQEAISSFFDSLTTTVEGVAQQLGTEVPRLVEGSFRQQLDDEGNVTSTTGTIGGRTFEDESFEEFQTRLTAENLIAVVGQIDEAADAIAERWRDSAEQLMEGAQLLVAVTEDMQEGFGLLEGENALRRTVGLVEELADSNQTLVEAYAALQQSTRMYEQALGLMGQSVDGTREELIRHADAITDAAGGIERATGLWQSFFSNFFSDVELLQAQLDRTRSAAGSELADVGLSTGISADAFRAAFENALAQGLSAEATAEWLEAADALASVIDLERQLADARRAQADLLQEVDDAVAQATGSLDPLEQEIRDINRQTDEWQRRAEELGLSEAELARIRDAGAQLVTDAVRRHAEEQADFILSIQDQIDEFDTSPFQQAMNDIAGSLDQTLDRGRELGLGMGELGGAFELAERQMQNAIAGLENRITDLSAELFGSGLEQLDAEIAAIRERFEGASEHGRIVERHLLEPLLEERERLAEQQRAAERLGTAQQLAQAVADLAGVRGSDDFAGIAEEFNFDLAELADILGVGEADIEQVLADMQAQSYSLPELASSIDDVVRSNVDRLIDAIIQAEGGTKPLVPETGSKEGGTVAVVATSGDAAGVGAAAAEQTRTAADRQAKAAEQANAQLATIVNELRTNTNEEQGSRQALVERLQAILETLQLDGLQPRRSDRYRP